MPTPTPTETPSETSTPTPSPTPTPTLTDLPMVTEERENGPNNIEIWLLTGNDNPVFSADVTFDFNISFTPSGTNSGSGTLLAGQGEVFIANYDSLIESVSAIQVNNFDPPTIDGYNILPIG